MFHPALWKWRLSGYVVLGPVYIADEVQGGFARTGTHIVEPSSGIRTPDIVTLGKPHGEWLPHLRRVIARAELINEFGRAPPCISTPSAATRFPLWAWRF